MGKDGEGLLSYGALWLPDDGTERGGRADPFRRLRTMIMDRRTKTGVWNGRAPWDEAKGYSGRLLTRSEIRDVSGQRAGNDSNSGKVSVERYGRWLSYPRSKARRPAG